MSDPPPSTALEQAPRGVLALLLVAVVGLAYAGQRIFTVAPKDRIPVVGVLLQVAAAGLLGCLLVVASPRARTTRYGRGLSRLVVELLAQPDRTMFGLGAVAASLAATLLAQLPNRSWLSLGAWLLTMLLIVTAASSGTALGSWRSFVRTHSWEIGSVVACVVVAFVLRSVRLATVPPIIGGDEASMGLEARDILSGRNTQLFVTGWLGMPRMTFLLMAIPMKLWGNNIYGLRMHAALVGTATIIPMYWLFREGSVWLAQLAIWLLATYPYHIHFSRLGANNIEDSFLLAATFGALFWAIRQKKPLGWALAGLFAALSLFFYPGARLVIVLAVGYIGMLGLLTRGRFPLQHWRGLLLGSMVFLLVGLPMIQFYANHWDDFNARLNEVGIIQSGMLAREVQATGKSAVAIMWRQFTRTLFAWGFYRDQTVWYNDTEALLQFWPALLFPLGLAVAWTKWRERLYLLLILWFFGIVILGGTLTENPPSYARLNGLAIVLVGLVALAIMTIACLGQHLDLWKRRVSLLGSALVVAVLGMSGIYHYFVDYAPRYSYGSLNGEVATVAGTYMSKLPPAYHAYLMGPPRLYFGFSTMPFLAPQITGSDIKDPINALPTEYDPSHPAFFFAVPERQTELQTIQRLLPGGHWLQFDRVTDHSPLFYAYQVDHPVAH